MRFFLVLFTALAVSGCSIFSSPPEPSMCEGEFRPINIGGTQTMRLTPSETLAICTGVNNEAQG